MQKPFKLNSKRNRLSTQLIPIPEEITGVVLDTVTGRDLVVSTYNERVTECQIAENFFGISALRDISLDTFQSKAENLPPIPRRRAKHVIMENQRTFWSPYDGSGFRGLRCRHG